MTELICITCPRGCHLQVDETGGTVSGNHCSRGEAYGRSELLHPVRTVTSTIPIRGAAVPRLPVKTDRPIPKEQVFACMDLIHAATAQAPVAAGDILYKDVLGCGANLVAARTLKKDEAFRDDASCAGGLLRGGYHEEVLDHQRR